MHLLHNEDQADVVLIRVLPAVITTILTIQGNSRNTRCKEVFD